MKKLLLTILAVAILTTSFVGCSDPLAQGNQTATTVATQSSEDATETTTPGKTYEDNLEGLVNYMADKGYFKNEDKTKREMNAEIIGAEKGYLFTDNTAMVELYAFPTELNDTAKAVIQSVKSKGYYTLAETTIKAEEDTKIPAVLSEDEKYLLIYNDSAIKADQETTESQKREKAIEDFKAFNK